MSVRFHVKNHRNKKYALKHGNKSIVPLKCWYYSKYSSNSGDSVKCQRCGTVYLTSTKPRSNRIDALQKQIKWIENYSRGNNNRPSYTTEVTALKQELAELLEEDAKADKLRSLPLYSCKIAGWKFVCSKCYDKICIAKTSPRYKKVL
jgi:hypothetical protein